MASKKSRKKPTPATRQSHKPTRSAELATRAKEFIASYESKQFSTALVLAESLTHDFPNALFGWKALGTCLMESGEPEQAITPLQKALEIKADDLESHTNIAKAYQMTGLFEKATEHLEEALEISPDDYHANIRIADIYQQKGELSSALVHLDKSLDSNKNSFLSPLRKSSALVEKHEYEQALPILEGLVENHDTSPGVHTNLANLYSTMGRFDEAEKHYKQAIDLAGDQHIPFSNYYFTAHYNPKHSADDLLQIASLWNKKFALEPQPRPDADRNKKTKLRIGLVSKGLNIHPVGQMITAALSNLEKHEFSLHAYSDKLSNDRIAKKLQGIVSTWEEVPHLSDRALADKIRKDGIDILIDMTGHTSGNRLKTIALEPAPLIVKWVGGLFNTAGLKSFDYLISDNIETPEGVDDYYWEKLIRLPDDYICYMAPDYAPPVSRLPALSNGYVTFGCFNNPAKVNDQLLAEWSALMHQVPDSRLYLKGGQYTNSDYCERVYATLEYHDINRERVILEGPANHQALLEAYNRVDIALDPWPYSGGLTTCEAMLMGVPVVTLPGPTFAGRHSATHLTNAGMPELVTSSWDEYRQRVTGLASDLQSLSTIRTHLRDILLQSPVCDGPRFAKHFTTAMRAIWQRYCDDKAPAALTLNQQGEAQFEGEDHPVEILHPEPIKDEQSEFSWQFQGKIVAIDNGAGLASSQGATKLLKLSAFSVISFDPASKVANAEQLKAAGEVHHYPHTILGDGKPATLYACLDPAMSATLRPLQAVKTLTGEEEGPKVLAELPINTIQLDKIEGLEAVDWLILDNLNDSLAVLENGVQTLVNTLLIQVRVNFQPTHEKQPELTLISHWAARHGFSFYRLNDPAHISHLPKRDDLTQRQATQLASADAIYVPNAERMAELTNNQRMKLAFVLHTVYGVKDLSYELINKIDEELAQRYLVAEGFSEPTCTVESTELDEDTNQDAEGPQLPSAPFMTESERKLFKKCLTDATAYFEFGSGGSTVWAVEQGLAVSGVESDGKWVNSLKQKLGERCQVRAVDIGPTREWGHPVSMKSLDKFPAYSLAIHEYDTAFDLILVDGRFRVACTVAAIQHILAHHRDSDKARIFIHDFWNRPQYHPALEFLETVEKVESAGVFKIKPGISLKKLERIWESYAREPA